jgi:hypothetical protein
MDDFTPGLVIGTFLTIVVFLMIGLFADLRFYTNIKAQCQKQGFIQDSTTRINCSLEEN